jgi:hypothetical protein
LQRLRLSAQGKLTYAQVVKHFHSSRARLLLVTSAAAALLLNGCDGALNNGEMDPEDELLPCDPALMITAMRSRVAPDGVVILSASGGTGRPRFELDGASATGARIDEASGVFVAGGTPGSDVVVVRDQGCIGEARTTITTTEAFSISPAMAELEPTRTLRFTTSGGSGTATFAIMRSTAGGSVDAMGNYRATMLGEDLVRATDMGTGATADALVRVVMSAALRPALEFVAIPENAGFEPRILGGSGEFDLVSSAGSIVSVEGTTLTGAAPGRATIQIDDRFTGASAMMNARTALRLEATSTYVGDRSDATTMIARDVNGDGFADAILAMPMSSLGPVRGGAVLIYAGSASGLSSTPSRVYVGERRDDNFGQSVAVADLDNDGHAELLVGAWQADNTSSNAGAVYIYRGVAGAFFADAHSEFLSGLVGNDRFGVSVAACDLDGDGFRDVIVGAADSEDRDRVPRLSNHGAIFVHANIDGRILSSPTQTIHGEVFLADGTRTAHNDVRFGSALAAGDMDGDMLCDLAVYSSKPDPMTGDDGAVSVYRGRRAAMARRGGLEDTPMLYIAATEMGARSSRFGRTLALGDIDGDGRDELAVGQPLFDSVDSMMRSQDQTGAVRLFRGRVAGMTTSVLQPSMADVSITSDAANLQIGYAVAIADANGDGRRDLISGDARRAAMGSMITRPGMVHVYTASSGALPDATADRAIEGLGNEDRFGWALTPLVGGDGRGDRIAIYAGLVDDAGYDTGKLYVADGAGALTPLTLPLQRGGRRLGQSVAALDFDGDMQIDLAVGAPLEAFSGMSAAGTELRGTQLGAVHIYRGDGTSWPASPSFTLRGFANHSEADQLGDALLAPGDYDGDGRADLLALSRLEDRSTGQAAGYALESGCDFTTAANDAGALLLLRGSATVSGTSAPSLAIFGDQAGRPIQSFASLDFDGDGELDIAMGSSGWAQGSLRGGGVWLVRHRDLSGAMPVAVCAPDVSFGALRDGDDFGLAMVSLGDVDADGCDDLAVGAPRAERVAMAAGLGDEGMVAILFGGGAGCRTAAPQRAWIASGNASSSAGSALASGDLDGDGRRELVIGARTFRNGVGEIGRAFVIDGRRLASLRGSVMAPRDAGSSSDAGVIADSGTSPDAAMPDAGAPMGPSDVTPFASLGAAVIEGTTAGERLGTSVAVTRYRGMPAVAFGAPWANVSGLPDTGGVRFARWSAGVLTPLGIAVSGEDDEEGTELGFSMIAFTRGTTPFLLIGAPWSNVGVISTPSARAPYAHEGAAYVVDLGDP